MTSGTTLSRPVNINPVNIKLFTDNSERSATATVRETLAILEVSETDNGTKNTPSTKVPDYTNLADRLTSYDGWPNKAVSKESLAKAGFYFTQQDDIVRCPYCKIEGHQWVAGDDPMEDHRRWTPFCPFVQQNTEHDTTSPQTTAPAQSQDTCGLYNVEIFPNSVPEDARPPLDLEKFGIVKNRALSHPDKFSLSSRLQTFNSWPKSIKQRPHELAEAGFFYVGVGDRTLCFHCGGGLQDWEPNDVPWEQHALWFPLCNYVLQKKGVEYIKEVKAQNEPNKSASTSSSVETKEKEEQSNVPACVSETESEEEGVEKKLCRICFKNELDVVFLPCRHMVACVECAAPLKTCALCRRPLEATMRVFTA